LRNVEIKLEDRKDTTGTSEDEETAKDLEICPHAPKKLHNSTVKEYEAPLVNRLLGTRRGRDNDKENDFDAVRLERYCWRGREEESETMKEMDFQSRPPEPTEELKSNDKSSHAPSSFGRFKVTTTGDKRLGSTEIVMLWCRLKGQDAQSGSTLEVQRAFNTFFFNSITSPTFNADTEYISSDFSFTHRQREGRDGAIGEGEEVIKWNNLEQFEKDFDERPFVSISNSRTILLPSEENTARFIFGPGTEASEAFTVKSELKGKITSTSPLPLPDTVTFKEYRPIVFGIPSGAWRYLKETKEFAGGEPRVRVEG
jgi:hypothetical protein